MVVPILDRAFFEQAVFKGEVGDQFFQVARLAAQVLHVARRRLTLGVAGKPPLAGFEEFLRPRVIKALSDPLAPAQLGDRMIASKAGQDDADLLLGRIPLPRRPANVLDMLLGRFFRPGFSSHLRYLKGYDEPKILRYAKPVKCPKVADGLQSVPPWRSTRGWVIQRTVTLDRHASGDDFELRGEE